MMIGMTHMLLNHTLLQVIQCECKFKFKINNTQIMSIIVCETSQSDMNTTTLKILKQILHIAIFTQKWQQCTKH